MARPHDFFFKAIDGYTARTRYELMCKAAQSPYRWWYETLRCSQDYWRMCQTGGKSSDQRLRAVWDGFGDVFSGNFVTWWCNRGHQLFSEFRPLPQIEVLNPRDLGRSSLDVGYIWVSLPMMNPDKLLKVQFNELLRQHRERTLLKSSSAFPLAKTSRIRIGVIEEALNVWLRRQSGARFDGNPPNVRERETTSLYELGARLGLSPQHKIRPGESDAIKRWKKQVMRQAVIRATARAQALIANAEIGVFPSYAAVPERDRWALKPRDAGAFQRALKKGFWSPPGISTFNVSSYERMLRD